MKRIYYILGKNKFWEYVVFLVFFAFFYAPLLHMLLISFAGHYDYPAPIPRTFGLKWWNYIFSKAKLVNSIGQSLGIAVISTCISLAVCLPAAYAIARFSFRGRSLVRMSFLLTNAFPKMGIYTAMALLFYKLHLIGTLTGVVLVHIVNTMMFMVWIPGGAFRMVHRQQEESARDAGASPWRAFLHVTLPLAWPGIVTAALYTFLGSMEEAQGTLLIGLPAIHTMPSELYGLINLWFTIPFTTMLLSAALSKVEDSYIESARDVGFSRLRIFYRIILPIAGKDMIMAAVFILMGQIGSFTIPYLTGPNNPKMLGIMLYQQVGVYLDYGRAAALSVLMFLLCLGGVVGYIKTVMKDEIWETGKE